MFGDSSLGEAVLELRADGKPLEQDLSGAEGRVHGILGRMGDMIGGTLKVGLLAAGAGILAGVTGIVAGAGTSIAAAIDVEKIAAQTDAVLKSTKGVAGVTKEMVVDVADSLSKLVGVDDDAVVATENLLLTFTKINKTEFPEATKAIVDMATALNGGAIPSMEQMHGTTLQVGKALNDFSGFSALKKAGVSFTQDQIKLIEGFKKTNDLASYQKLVLKELSTEFGEAGAAAGDTFAGKMARLQVVVGNVQEAIGAKLLPFVTKLLDKLLSFIDSSAGEKFINNVLDGVEKGMRLFEDLLFFIQSGDISDVFADLSNLFGANTANFISTILDGVEGIVRLLLTGDFTGGIFGLFEDDAWITGLIDGRAAVIAIAEAIGNIVRLMITGDFNGGIFGLTEDDPWISALLDGRDALIAIGQWVGTLWTNLTQGDWGAAWQTIVTGAQTAKDFLAPLLTAWATDIWNWLTGEGGALSQVSTKLTEFTNGVGAWLQENGPKTWAQLQTWATDFWNWVTGPGGLIEVGTARIYLLANTIANELETQWVNTIDPALVKWRTDLVAWSSSEEVQNTMRNAGDNMGKAVGEGFVKFFTEGWTKKEGSGDDPVTAFINSLGTRPMDPGWKALMDAGGNFAKALWDGFVNAFSTVLKPEITKWVSEFITPIRDEILKQMNPLNWAFPSLPLPGAGQGVMPTTIGDNTAPNVIPYLKGLSASGSVGAPLHVYIDGQEIKNAVKADAYTDIQSLFTEASAAVGGGEQ